MSQGSADSIGQLLGQNPIYLNASEWEKVALSGRGIYTPLFKNDNEFHHFGLGPKLLIDEHGNASITGAAGSVEGFLVRWADNKQLFEKKLGREPDGIPQSSLGNTRAQVLDSLFKYSQQERKNRDMDYILVSTGALRPWAKQMAESIDKVESSNIVDREGITKDLRSIVQDRPILRTVINNIWKKDVDGGKMTRHEYEKRRGTYLEGF